MDNLMTMELTEALRGAANRIEDYKINRDGVITSPGKFETQKWYVPYFYDICLTSGISCKKENETDVQLQYCDYFLFDINKKYSHIRITEEESGFVSVSFKKHS